MLRRNRRKRLDTPNLPAKILGMHMEAGAASQSCQTASITKLEQATESKTSSFRGST